MEIVLQIPEALATLLPRGESLSRDMLEAYAADAYRNEKLSLYEVSQLLGLDRWKAEEFLARRQAMRPYGFEDRELELNSAPSFSPTPSGEAGLQRFLSTPDFKLTQEKFRTSMDADVLIP